MTIKLSKVSLPRVWTKEFDSLHDAITELRRHICGTCLDGGEWDDAEPLDIEFEGRRYVCMDAGILLSTGCGCEYELEGDHGLWPLPQDMHPNAHRRVSRRKVGVDDLIVEQLAA